MVLTPTPSRPPTPPGAALGLSRSHVTRSHPGPLIVLPLIGPELHTAPGRPAPLPRRPPPPAAGQGPTARPGRCSGGAPCTHVAHRDWHAPAAGRSGDGRPTNDDTAAAHKPRARTAAAPCSPDLPRGRGRAPPGGREPPAPRTARRHRAAPPLTQRKTPALPGGRPTAPPLLPAREPHYCTPRLFACAVHYYYASIIQVAILPPLHIMHLKSKPDVKPSGEEKGAAREGCLKAGGRGHGRSRGQAQQQGGGALRGRGQGGASRNLQRGRGACGGWACPWADPCRPPSAASPRRHQDKGEPPLPGACPPRRARRHPCCPWGGRQALYARVSTAWRGQGAPAPVRGRRGLLAPGALLTMTRTRRTTPRAPRG
jgi:hypothetical protein